MTNLTPVTNTPEFLNPALKKATQMILSIDANIKARQYDIASILAKVEKDKLYTDDGFSSAVEYASTTFGIGKTLAYELITIGTEYTREIRNNKGAVVGHASNLVPASNPAKQDAPLFDFTTTQIARCLSLGREKVLELIEANELSPRMTVRQIVDTVKKHKPPKQLKAPAQPTEPDAPAQPTEPDAPAQPTEPDAPAQPTEPDAPAQPTEPALVIEPEPEYIETVRGNGFDQISTDVLIAELRLRGFRVFNQLVTVEMMYTWTNKED